MVSALFSLIVRFFTCYGRIPKTSPSFVGEVFGAGGSSVLPRQVGKIGPKAVLSGIPALTAAGTALCIFGAVLPILAGVGSAAAVAGHIINSINSV